MTINSSWDSDTHFAIQYESNVNFVICSIYECANPYITEMIIATIIIADKHPETLLSFFSFCVKLEFALFSIRITLDCKLAAGIPHFGHKSSSSICAPHFEQNIISFTSFTLLFVTTKK